MRPTLIRWRCNSALAAALVAAAAVTLSGCAVAPAQDLGDSLTRVHTAGPRLPQRPARRITAENPARLMVIGDSLSQGFAMGLEQRVAERGLPIRVRNHGKVSSGLSRPDFHDWPGGFAALAAEERPDIVVAHFGANDMQGVTRPGNTAGYGSEEWDSAYRIEVRRILASAAENGAVLVWLGPAPDGNPALGRHMQRIAPLFRAEAEASGAVFFPLAPFAAGPDGEYVKAATLDGRSVTIRTGDRSHFTLTGYRLLADRILDDLLRRFPDLAPGGDDLAVLQ